MRIRSCLALIALSVAGCVPKALPPAPTSPAPQPAPMPVPTAAPLAADWRDWRDWPLTPGIWSYARDDRGSIARFGQSGTDALLTLRCDQGERRLSLARAGTALGSLTIRTTTTTRAVPVRPVGGALAYVAATFTARDPLLEAIGFSRGRFVVEQAGAPLLVIPAWAEIERVTEDCRGVAPDQQREQTRIVEIAANYKTCIATLFDSHRGCGQAWPCRYPTSERR